MVMSVASRKRGGTMKYYRCAGSRARIAIFPCDWRRRRSRCVGGYRGRRRSARRLRRRDETPRMPIGKSSSPGTSARWRWREWRRNAGEGWTKPWRRLIALWYGEPSPFLARLWSRSDAREETRLDSFNKLDEINGMIQNDSGSIPNRRAAAAAIPRSLRLSIDSVFTFVSSVNKKVDPFLVASEELPSADQKFLKGSDESFRPTFVLTFKKFLTTHDFRIESFNYWSLLAAIPVFGSRVII